MLLVAFSENTIVERSLFKDILFVEGFGRDVTRVVLVGLASGAAVGLFTVAHVDFESFTPVLLVTDFKLAEGSNSVLGLLIIASLARSLSGLFIVPKDVISRVLALGTKILVKGHSGSPAPDLAMG
jgi:hypothetical protein